MHHSLVRVVLVPSQVEEAAFVERFLGHSKLYCTSIGTSPEGLLVHKLM